MMNNENIKAISPRAIYKQSLETGKGEKMINNPLGNNTQFTGK